MEGNQTVQSESFIKALSEIKQRILSEIDNLSAVIKNNSELVTIASRELQDAKWYLGEERTRREHLENELKTKIDYINTLEIQLHSLRTNYSEAQWFLGEERAKRAHLENTAQGAQQRCESLEEENKQIRNQNIKLEDDLRHAQWYLGEEKSKREQSERALQELQSALRNTAVQ